MPQKRRMFICLVLFFAALWACAHASVPVYVTYLDVEVQGAPQDILLEANVGAFYSISLLGEETGEVYLIADNYHLYPETNVVDWNGYSLEGEEVPPGPYVVNVYLLMPGAEPTETPSARQIEPAPPGAAPLTDIVQSTQIVTGAGIYCDLNATIGGTLEIFVDDRQTGEITPLMQMQIGVGPMRFRWDATRDDERVAEGEYALIIRYETEAGEAFAPEPLSFSVVPVSEAYSKVRDLSFWSMAPGETDDKAIWDVLIQPITVFDNNVIGAAGHTYMMENPDGTGKRVAQVHGLSQGLHVIGSVNEHGYVLVETFSNYDPEYQPRTPEAREHAFDIKQGYLEAKYLKTLEVNQHIGLVVDKLTQRMYVFIDGKRVTELIVSTGYQGRNQEKLYRETRAGEFITISYPGGFYSEEIFSDFGVRYNGGSLLHEVPCIFVEGKRQYAQFERLLGRKASAGCVRIQRELNPEGYNSEVIFRLLRDEAASGVQCKILIWDDLNRIDTPEVWYQSPFDLQQEPVAVPMLPV